MAKKQGPGIWLHKWCADEASNLVEMPSCIVDDAPTIYCTRDHPNGHWDNKWWIPLPEGYRSKYRDTCPWCNELIRVGDLTQKVAVATKGLWGDAA